MRPEKRIQHSPPAPWLGLFVSPDARQKPPSRAAREGNTSFQVCSTETDERSSPSSRWATARASLLFFARFACFSSHAHPSRIVPCNERFVQGAQSVNARNIFTELKRRNVYRAAVAYGVVAWFLTQLTTQVFPRHPAVAYLCLVRQWNWRHRT